MLTLMEKVAGIPALARRWITYVRENRDMRAEILLLKAQAQHDKARISKLILEVQAFQHALLQLKTDEQKIPEDALRLIHDAANLFEQTVNQRDFPRHFALTWLGEWRALRYDRSVRRSSI